MINDTLKMMIRPVRQALTASVIGMALACAASNAEAGQVLDKIEKAGSLRCGIPTGSAGLAKVNDAGVWEGFHADFCRALAAAALGDSKKVEFVTVTDLTRFTALQSGEIDVLVTASAYTFARDTELGLAEVIPYFYTGQGVLVKKDLSIKSLKELDQASICVTQGSVIESNLSDYAARAGIKFKTVAYDKQEMVEAAFFSGRCDAISNDTLTLASNRKSSSDPNAYEVLPELISKEPQGPFVQASDPDWAGVVKWTLFAMFQAEEWGITPENVDERVKADDPAVKRFLGLEKKPGPHGLAADWAYKVVKEVGNYGTIYEKNIGASGLGLDRGPNKPWNEGGLLISPLW